MDILENSLIRKYFWCKQPCPDGEWQLHPGTCRAIISERILDAMQQPIMMGERYLLAPTDGKIQECVWNADSFMGGFHPNYLRLSDRFQKKKECDCHPKHPENCHCTCHDPQLDEEKCGQCGQSFSESACGPTHAIIWNERKPAKEKCEHDLDPKTCLSCNGPNDSSQEPTECNSTRYGNPHCGCKICRKSHNACSCHGAHKPADPVEEKIKNMGAAWYADLYQSSENPVPILLRGPYKITKMLRKLVALARK